MSTADPIRSDSDRVESGLTSQKSYPACAWLDHPPLPIILSKMAAPHLLISIIIRGGADSVFHTKPWVFNDFAWIRLGSALDPLFHFRKFLRFCLDPPWIRLDPVRKRVGKRRFALTSFCCPFHLPNSIPTAVRIRTRDIAGRHLH